MLKKLFCLIKFIWFHPLNQNNRLAAVWRMISFQIASRIIKASIILPFVNDTQLITTHGMTGATGDWYCGLREYEDMGFLLHALQSGDLFVDVGANIGSYSILAGACEGVKVIAFEPVPQTFSWLQKNIKINALENRIEAMNIGLAEQKGSINFSSNLDSLNHVVLQEKNNTSVVKVDVSKLDDILDDKFPTVIKIDVEGYELQVLNGAKRILDNPSLIAVIIELGVGQKEQELNYHIFNEPALNSFSKELSEIRDKAQDSYFIKDVIKVEVKPLNKILDTHLINNEIDFLNVDVEGLDLDVLKSNDWSKYRPKFVLVEILSSSLHNIDKDPIFQLMKEKKYIIFSKQVNTVFKDNFVKN